MSDELSRAFDTARNIALARGEVLFRTGDEVRWIFLVRSGQVHLCRHTAAGARLVLQRGNPGQILAEASAYSPRYHCDAVAALDSQLARLARSTFARACRDDPGLAEIWASTLARSVQSARFRAEIRTLKRVADRLDAWLSEFGDLPPKGRWQDVAAEIGTSREALYREIARRRAG